MISERSRLSLAQYLGLQGQDVLDVLFRKHSLRSEWDALKGWAGSPAQGLVALLPDLPADRLLPVLEEVVRTEGDLHDRAVDDWRHRGAGLGARAEHHDFFEV